MPIIKDISAREILDCRGFPTLEVKVEIDNGIIGKASVPAGTSKGSYEAYELRDNNFNYYEGQGVTKACHNINHKIRKVLYRTEITNQQKIDQIMIDLDETQNKSKIGGNAILGVSLASARAAAKSLDLPLYQYLNTCFKFQVSSLRLPRPMFNIFNGGKHADTNLDIQEIMIVPLQFSSFKEMVEVGAKVFHTLKTVLKNRGLDTDTGTEGGYAPDISSTLEAIELIIEAIKEAGLTIKQMALALDIGAATLYDKRKKSYIFKLDESFLNSTQLLTLYQDWIKKYPIVSFEDPFDENDWPAWSCFQEELKRLSYGKNKKEILLVGDDLFTTNVKRLKKGIQKKAVTAIIIKPNQIGTLTETMNCIRLAKRNNYKIIISHRSGDTNDTFIADLAVGIGAQYIKAGSLSRGERVAKYNRLMEIEEELLQ